MKTNFSGNDDLISRLKTLGFIPFGPGHSSKNGYEKVVNNNGRRACFCDNRIYGESKIHFRVVDYGDNYIHKKFIFNLFTIVRETRYQILDIALDHDPSNEEIEILLKVATCIP
jgi:hypothetical protein